MEMDIVQIISQVGFPIAVACYVLIVLNNTVKKNTEILIKISEQLDIDEKE